MITQIPKIGFYLMKKFPFCWGLFIALGSLLNSCTQPGIIGSDLLEGDQINVEFTDQLGFTAYLRTTDSIQTYGPGPNEQLFGYMCGQFSDPVFGLTTAVINAQLLFTGGFPPDFEGAVLDSMVFILPYRPTQVYGDTTETYNLEVYLLDEPMSDTASYFSNKHFAATQLIGSASVVPKPNDSIEILVHGSDSMETQLVIPQVRIRMDDLFANNLIHEDSLVFESDSAFLEKYKGFQIRTNGENKGMLSFNLSAASGGMIVYYHVDTVFAQYGFRFNATSPRMVSYTHDYTGSLVSDFLADSTLCDSLLFIQGNAGLGTVIEFPDADLLQGKIINRAELELTIITLPEDGGLIFDPSQQLVVSEIKEDGSLELIPDVTIGLNRNDLDLIFGGVPDEDAVPQTYRMNLSAYFKDLKNGDAGNKLLITPLYRAERTGRVVICGPKHPQYPAKIKLSLTDY